MTAVRRNRVKITKNAKARSVTLKLERRDGHGLVERISFTVPSSTFDRALLDAQIIAPWNRVQP